MEDHRRPQTYTEVTLQVPQLACDAVCNYIIENIAHGVVLSEEEDASTVGITFYLTENSPADYQTGLLTYLEQILDDSTTLPAIRQRTVKNVEWIEQYKSTVKPIRLERGIVVRPTWSQPLPDTRYDIIIDPRMAFGTGTHETTRSCLNVIAADFEPGWRFLDVGCGSGILSILAAQMGASYIKALDYDVAAIDNSRDNFTLNNVTVPHDIMFGSIDKCASDEPYDFVCANIIKSTILTMLSRLVQLTRPGGILVLSGLLQEDEAEIDEALNSLGEERRTILRDNEWLTYTVRCHE